MRSNIVDLGIAANFQEKDTLYYKTSMQRYEDLKNSCEENGRDDERKRVEEVEETSKRRRKEWHYAKLNKGNRENERKEGKWRREDNEEEGKNKERRGKKNRRAKGRVGD